MLTRRLDMLTLSWAIILMDRLLTFVTVNVKNVALELSMKEGGSMRRNRLCGETTLEEPQGVNYCDLRTVDLNDS